MAPRTLTADVAGIEERLDALRELPPPAARDAVWTWFVEAGQRYREDPSAAGEELAALFRAGRPASDLDGSTRGALVTLTGRPGLARLGAAVAALWMPWRGKRFQSAAHHGDNVLAPAARWPARLLWPGYRPEPGPEGLIGFEYETRVEPSALDPAVEVLVLDYAAPAANPRFLVSHIRDELMEIVPGAYLGQALWQAGGGRHTRLGWFALHRPAA